MFKMSLLMISVVMLLFCSGCGLVRNDDSCKGICTGSGADHQVICGSVNVKDAEYVNLTVNGSAQLDNVSIKEQLTVNGSLSALGLHTGVLFINGKSDLQKMTVQGKCTVNGYVEAKDSTFSDIVFRGKKATFSDSKIKAITVRKDDGNFVGQTVELYNTKVDGDIVFEQGDGKVVLKGSSSVTGKVTGGVLEK